MRAMNPILPGFHPDPSICRVGDDYYLVTSSFEYVPGVPIFHSRDLVHWRQLGYCLTRPEQLPLPRSEPSLGIFAPTIRFHQGTFYLIATNMDLYEEKKGRCNFYVTASDPRGPWSDPIWLEQGGIDPSLFFDDDGAVYLTSTADQECGIQQSQIDPVTGKLLTEPCLIWRGTGGAYPEGPHLYKIADYYYLMIAEGGTEYGHMETLARAPTPWGPWEVCPHNPILSHRSLHHPVQATGHADLVQAHDDSWWLVCLGVRPQPFTKLHHLGRETFLAPVVWDASGWPHVGDNGRIQLSFEGPQLPSVPWPSPAARDDFDQPTLGLDWNFLRWPQPGSWSLTARPGFLRLVGNAATLDQGRGVAFVGRRQEHAQCTAAAQLEFEPQIDGHEAGLVVWMNAHHHYEIALTRHEGERCVIVRRRIGSLTAIVAREPVEAGPITLSIRAIQPRQPAWGATSLYLFSYASADEEPHELARGEARYLASEVAGGFTGVYFALYATTNGAATSVAADFDWFEYRPDPE
ncbi:glycoside hydrolase family 43 protein [Thermogemmatispora sp.]|uniref:glycoside hydrolase family 43 protein n=1 Tax=Thermogemmatispora sp. TaxID=1968838 RepID=UPI001DD7EE46|nr:glycoside hydrolase family 43 protein [Thermogemmatispora sp.]MBX5448433.1 glycoside hydrolase family 43 protein [Thermogemmatispora sp.]